MPYLSIKLPSFCSITEKQIKQKNIYSSNIKIIIENSTPFLLLQTKNNCCYRKYYQNVEWHNTPPTNHNNLGMTTWQGIKVTWNPHGMSNELKKQFRFWRQQMASVLYFCFWKLGVVWFRLLLLIFFFFWKNIPWSPL